MKFLRAIKSIFIGGLLLGGLLIVIVFCVIGFAPVDVRDEMENP